MRATASSLTLAAEDADGISQTQNPAANADLTINGALASGGVATMDVARRVLITSGADDRTVTFTIYGTNQDGVTIQESIAGSNASTTYTLRDFKTVTRIATSGNAGSLTVGTNQVASTAWIPINHRNDNISVGFRVSLSSGASLTYDVEHTLSDIQDINVVQTGVIEVGTHAVVTAKTTEADGNYVLPIRGMRLTITAFTSGTATITEMQGG